MMKTHTFGNFNETKKDNHVLRTEIDTHDERSGKIDYTKPLEFKPRCMHEVVLRGEFEWKADVSAHDPKEALTEAQEQLMGMLEDACGHIKVTVYGP